MGLVPSNGNQDFVVSSDGRERNWGGGSDRVTRNILKFASLKRRAILSENFFTIRRPIRLPLPIISRTCDPNMFRWHVNITTTLLFEKTLFVLFKPGDRRIVGSTATASASVSDRRSFVWANLRISNIPPSFKIEKGCTTAHLPGLLFWYSEWRRRLGLRKWCDELELCDVVVRASPSVRCSWVRANYVAD